MRRLLVLTAIVLAVALPAPTAAHTPSRPCSISVDPGRGGPRDVYRITGKHFPMDKNGGSLEVQVDIMRVIFDDNGERLELQSVFTLALVPGIHTFYFDYNDQVEGAPSRLRPGHYVVGAEASHQQRCRTVSGFDVVRGG